MPVKQSICYQLFQPKEMSRDELFRTVKKIGYAAIEMWFRDEHFEEEVAAAKKHKLAFASMCGHRSLGVGLNDPAEHDRIEAELRESIDIAAKVGIPGVICFSGNRREGLSDEEGIEITAKGLRRVAPYAEKKGVNLNIELLNSKVDHAGYQCDHTAWGVAVCKKVKSPRVKLLYDIYHMQIMEGDVIRTVTQHIQWIGHFHTAGVPGRRDLDETQELYYQAIMKAISGAGYGLFVGHEFRPVGDAIEALRKTFPLCDR
jgi:hydroxypyruvate isomerase